MVLTSWHCNVQHSKNSQQKTQKVGMFHIYQSSDNDELITFEVNMPGKADLDPNKHLEVQSACMFVGEPMS